MTTTTSTPTDRHLDGITHPRARDFFLLDAALTGANGLAYLAAAPLLADWFGASTLLVRELGVFLLLVAAGVAWLATRQPIPRRGAVALAEFNTLWVVASLAYAALGDLTAVGVGWVLLQAALVGGFATVQFWFARRG